MSWQIINTNLYSLNQCNFVRQPELNRNNLWKRITKLYHFSLQYTCLEKYPVFVQELKWKGWITHAGLSLKTDLYGNEICMLLSWPVRIMLWEWRENVHWSCESAKLIC